MQQIKNKLRGFSHDTSLRTKLVVLFTVLLLIPMGLFAYYSANRISEKMQDLTLSAAYKTISDTASTIDTKTKRATRTVEQLSYNDLIYKIISAKSSDYSTLQQFNDSKELISTFENLELLSEVDRILLYVSNDYLDSKDSRYIRPISDISSLPKYASLSGQKAHQWFSPEDFAAGDTDSQKTYSCMRMLYDPTAYNKPTAVLRIDLFDENVEEALFASSPTENGTVLLLDSDGNVISSYEETNIPVSEDDISRITSLSEDDWQTLNVNNESCYFYSLPLHETGWKLVTIIPKKEIFNPGNKMRNELLLVAVGLVALSLLFAFIISNLLTRRIKALSKNMQKVEAGEIDITPLESSHDEVGQLILHFNSMMERLQLLLDEQMQHGIEVKNLELKALQAQINPHFLYNTLDTINSIAFEKDSPEIRELVNALATFYRISLNKGEEELAIKDEVLHAKMYSRIQSYRFADQVDVKWNIDDDILNNKIIKIVLQPIIENAMIHGIFEKDDSKGTIEVSGKGEGDNIHFTVSDDGIGMSEDVIASNFNSDDDGVDAPGGYGIRNINARLKIAYGAQYGLSCESTEGKGTTVHILIPAVL